VPDPGDRLAAVLALILEDGYPSVLFTERAEAMSRHPGEISFPGGLMDPVDGSLEATALREAHEEVGIDPSVPDILGALPPVHTVVSGILVTPFVATTSTMPELSISESEIARALTIPLRVLSTVEETRELHREGGRVFRGWWYETGEATVWGATGFMLHSLLELLRREAPWSTS
jgi:8-oxo-dGTP pyrophosphatase MutT (NUDIX family)